METQPRKRNSQYAPWGQSKAVKHAVNNKASTHHTYQQSKRGHLAWREPATREFPKKQSHKSAMAVISVIVFIALLHALEFMNFVYQNATAFSTEPAAPSANQTARNKTKSKSDSKKPKRRKQFPVPTFMIVGAERAGTTSLMRHLKAHPLVSGSQKAKNLHFFDQVYWRRFHHQIPRNSQPNNQSDHSSSLEGNEDNHARNQSSHGGNGTASLSTEVKILEQFYLNQQNFAPALTLAQRKQDSLRLSSSLGGNGTTLETNNTSFQFDKSHTNATTSTNVSLAPYIAKTQPHMTFDATPSYLYESHMVPALIQRLLPHSHQFIVSLRDPVERAYSHYVTMYGRNATMKRKAVTFEEVVNADLRVLREVGLLPPVIVGGGKNKSREEIQREFNWDQHHAMDKHHGDSTQAQPTNQNSNNTNTHQHGSFYGSKQQLQAWKAYLQSPKRHSTHGVVAKGLYAAQLQQWLEYFPKEAFLLINFHQLSCEYPAGNDSDGGISISKGTASKTDDEDKDDDGGSPIVFNALNSSTTTTGTNDTTTTHKRDTPTTIIGAQIVYERMLRFLNLPNRQSLDKSMAQERFAKSKYYHQAPKMKVETRLILEQLYEPFNAQLGDLVGKNKENDDVDGDGEDQNEDWTCFRCVCDQKEEGNEPKR